MSVGKLESLNKAVDRLSVTEQMEDLPERVREITTMLGSLELLLMPLLLPNASRGENQVKWSELRNLEALRDIYNGLKA